MDELYLAEHFQRFFSDIFLCCDEEKSGKASLSKTVELIKSGNVPDDAIAQIAEICWTPSSSHLSKKQFFSALKLVAAYQSNLSISNDLINSKLELPLPQFSWALLDIESPDLIELRNEEEYHTDSISISTDSEADSETVRCSLNISSPTSDSPTPTNSVQDRNWGWQGLVSEEQRQLLEEESSDRHSSDDDTEISHEVWIITPEQKEYYTKQFKSLQENTNALLAGSVARTFFEKSQLPVHELRKIWQLADITKDGALSLQEFFTAMHLVVLRKHKIPLPDILPPTLIPRNEPRAMAPIDPATRPSQTKEVVKEWTKFVDSPTSSISSPGIKPVNFDFQINQYDPDLRHPVPRRLTPEIACSSSSGHKQIDSGVLDLRSQNRTELSPSNQHNAFQRPHIKKVNTANSGHIAIQPPDDLGPVSLPAFPPPKIEKPPPPPPRTFKTHGRSSSLDLNKLTKSIAPPVVPPRVSPSGQAKMLMNQKSEGVGEMSEVDAPFANFENFEKYENVQENVIFPGDVYEAERKKLFEQLFVSEHVEKEPPRKHGAFEVYRKPGKSGNDFSVNDLTEAQYEEFEQLQIENAALLRTCQELSQKLADLLEKKMKLRIKLEQLETLQNGGCG